MDLKSPIQEPGAFGLWLPVGFSWMKISDLFKRSQRTLCQIRLVKQKMLKRFGKTTFRVFWFFSFPRKAPEIIQSTHLRR